MPSKFFRVATAGDTTDGRAITDAHIQEMAATYDPKTYGARVWLEHFRGIFPDGPFKALGDVTAVKAEQVDGKWTLFAQIDPTDDLKAINHARQKIYTSIELAVNFAKTGKSYLMGLAVTDSPSSLGTDMLAFSSQAATNPLDCRKLDAGNLFTAAAEAHIEWEDDTSATAGAGLFRRVKELLAGSEQKASDNQADLSANVEAAISAIADSQKGVLDQFSALAASLSQIETLGAAVAGLTTELGQQRDDVAALRSTLDKTPDGDSHRRPSSGAAGDYLLTDC